MTATTERLERIRAHQAARGDGFPPTVTYDDALAVLADLPGALMQARAWRGVTQRAAARQLGVSQRTWWLWESGAQPPGRAYAAPLLDWIRATRLLPDRRGRCVNGKHVLAATGMTRSPNGRTACRACSTERQRGYRAAGKTPAAWQRACARGHPWTPETTGHRRNGHRLCLICAKDRAAERARRCRNGHDKTTDTRDRLGRRYCKECKAASDRAWRARTAKRNAAQAPRSGSR